MNCLGCGCSEDRACTGGCAWVSPNICSNCALSKHGAKKFIEVAEETVQIKSGDLTFFVVKGGKK